MQLAASMDTSFNIKCPSEKRIGMMNSGWEACCAGHACSQLLPPCRLFGLVVQAMPVQYHASSDQNPPRAPVCLLLLCGLPGAGKTSLARALEEQAAQNCVEARLINFDEHGCQPSNTSRDAGDAGGLADGSFDAAAWQQARRQAMEAVEAALRVDKTTGGIACDAAQHQMEKEQQHAAPQSPAPCRLVIADDNMHLRGMRWQCYSLARTARAAAVLLYVRCSAAMALQRNASRPPAQRVPAHVITRMAETLEEPAGSSSCSEAARASRVGGHASSGSDDARRTAADGPGSSSSSSSGPGWEAASLVIWDGSQELTPAAAAVLWEQVWQRWGPSARPPRDAAAEAAARAAAQAATAASLAHAVDLATRQVLSQLMVQLAAVAQQHKQDAAHQLNAARRQVLKEAAAAGLGGGPQGVAARGGAAEAAADAGQGASGEATADQGQEEGAGPREAAVAAAAGRWAAAYRERCQSLLREMRLD